jgi:hypothetical protein
MSRSPTPKTDKEAYIKNTKEQYEALGRFVEAFEAMVNEARSTCIDILSIESSQERLLEVVFHHSALTAKPLFEIMRALIAEQLKHIVKISIKDIDVFRGVLSDIATEYFDLANTRNNLLHGTWYIGYQNTIDPNSETFRVNKYKPTKSGLAADDLPKEAGELLKLRDRCEKTRSWIGLLVECLPKDPADETRITNIFKLKKGRWRLGPEETSETLP